MGHLTALAETVDKAVETIKKARAILA